MSQARRFHLTITEPLPSTNPVAEIDITPDITELHTSTGIPGLFTGLTVKFATRGYGRRGELPSLAWGKGFQHVELSVNGIIAWAGRIDKPVLTAGVPNGFSAVGYGICALQDHWYRSSDTTPRTAGDVLRRVIGDAAPLIGVSNDPDTFIDSGIEHTCAEFDGMYPWDVVTALSTEGGSGAVNPSAGPGQPGSANSTDNAPYDWSVGPDRMGRFIPRTAPPLWSRKAEGVQGAQYWIDLDDDVDMEPDYTAAVSDVWVETTPPGGLLTRVGPVSDPDFGNRYGMSREALLKVAPMSTDQAHQIAEAYLALHNRPTMPVTIHRTGGQGLGFPYGHEQDPALVVAGSWVQVADQGPYYILSTERDWLADDLTVTAQAYPAGYWDKLADLEALTRAYARNLDWSSGRPFTGPEGLPVLRLTGSGPPGSAYESLGLVPMADGIWTWDGSSWRVAPYSP